jgi:hypothetical protein
MDAAQTTLELQLGRDSRVPCSAGFGDRCLVCNGLGGHEEDCRGTSAYDELRESILQLRIEVNCRIEHGAESGGHLEYVQSKLEAILSPNE